MKKMIIVLLAFCLISISCQSVPEDPSMNEEVKASDIIVTIELPESQINKLQKKLEDSDVRITLGNIQFEAESAVLLETEFAKLQKIAEILLDFPENDLLISGHAGYAGGEKGRIKISEDRANAVANYLVEMGIKSREQISTRSVGSNEPIALSDTPQNRALNRRVEITILAK